MITGFRHKGLRRFFECGDASGIQPAHAGKLRRVLGLLDVAATPEDLSLPGFRLHPLKGDLKGHCSVTVSGNWRVTFRFVGVNVELVDYQDYH